MEEGTIVRWLVSKGDVVKKGDILFEVETDKAVVEVEAASDGRVARIVVAEGETAPVQSLVAVLADTDQDAAGYLSDFGMWEVGDGKWEVGSAGSVPPPTSDFPHPASHFPKPHPRLAPGPQGRRGLRRGAGRRGNRQRPARAHHAGRRGARVGKWEVRRGK